MYNVYKPHDNPSILDLVIESLSRGRNTLVTVRENADLVFSILSSICKREFFFTRADAVARVVCMGTLPEDHNSVPSILMVKLLAEGENEHDFAHAWATSIHIHDVASLTTHLYEKTRGSILHRNGNERPDRVTGFSIQVGAFDTDFGGVHNWWFDSSADGDKCESMKDEAAAPIQAPAEDQKTKKRGRAPKSAKVRSVKKTIQTPTGPVWTDMWGAGAAPASGVM